MKKKLMKSFEAIRRFFRSDNYRSIKKAVLMIVSVLFKVIAGVFKVISVVLGIILALSLISSSGDRDS